jgi:hypothetical protein
MCSLFFENFTERFSAVGLKLQWGAQNPSRDGALACGFPSEWKLCGTRWILLTPPSLPLRTYPRVPSINLRGFVLLSRTRSTRHQKSSVGLLLPKPVSESATRKIHFSCYPFISFFSFSSLVLCEIGRDLCKFCNYSWYDSGELIWEFDAHEGADHMRALWIF